MATSGDGGSNTGSGFIGFSESSQQNTQPHFGYNRNRRGQSNFRHNQFRGGGGGNRNFGGGNFRGGFHGQRNFQPRQNFPQGQHQQKEIPIQVYFHPSMIEDPWTDLGNYKGNVAIKRLAQPDEVPNVDATSADDETVTDQPTTQQP